MPLRTFPVRLEKPTETLGKIMSEIRDWLDSKKIQPAEFKTIAADEGKVALDIRFRSEDEALLFEQVFART
jgi:hypothetical protein